MKYEYHSKQASIDLKKEVYNHTLIFTGDIDIITELPLKTKPTSSTALSQRSKKIWRLFPKLTKRLKRLSCFYPSLDDCTTDTYVEPMAEKVLPRKLSRAENLLSRKLSRHTASFYLSASENSVELFKTMLRKGIFLGFVKPNRKEALPVRLWLDGDEKGKEVCNWKPVLFKHNQIQQENITLNSIRFVEKGRSRSFCDTYYTNSEDNFFTVITETKTLEFEANSRAERDAIREGFYLILCSLTHKEELLL